VTDTTACFYRLAGWRLAAAAVFLLGPGLAFGGSVTLFSDFGAGDSFEFPGPPTPYCIGGNNPGCAGIDYQPAFAFTPGTTAYLTQVDLALYNAANGAEGEGVISVMTDSGGLPGSVIEQWTLTPGSNQVYTLTSELNPLLTAGTQYWLEATDTLGAGGVIGWDANSISETGSYADMETGSWVLENSNAPQGAFDILANTVNPNPTAPEPSSLALLGTGAALLVLARKKRKQP